MSKNNSEFCIIYVTCPDEREAHRISESLIKERLAACVNITNPVNSIYRWDEGIEQSSEYVLYIKTTKNHFNELKKAVKKEHSYDTPCIIMLNIEDGDEDFLNWIKKSVK